MSIRSILSRRDVKETIRDDAILQKGVKKRHENSERTSLDLKKRMFSKRYKCSDDDSGFLLRFSERGNENRI
jgi:hypothetical protein